MVTSESNVKCEDFALITRLRYPRELQGALIAEGAPATHLSVSVRWEYLLCQHQQLWFSKFLFTPQVCLVFLYELVNSSFYLEQFVASEALPCSSLQLCISDSPGYCNLPQLILIQCQAGKQFFKTNSILNFLLYFFILGISPCSFCSLFSLLIHIIDTCALLCHSSLNHVYLAYPKLLLNFI